MLKITNYITLRDNENMSVDQNLSVSQNQVYISLTGISNFF